MMARAWLERRLEAGHGAGPGSSALAHAWEKLARIDRSLVWRSGAAVVAIGGATLGGSGKTPLAIACARELREGGARVALIGHAYGARPGRARRVADTDSLEEVGDEALACARSLRRDGVPVVVAPSRQEALDLALEGADIAVVDGLHQTAPRRATLAILAVDAAVPWGGGACPPLGDLRAPRASLLAAADVVMAIGEPGEDARLALADARLLGTVASVSRGATTVGARPVLLDWETLRQMRVGLWTAVAHPERLTRMLASHQIHPVATSSGRDHRLPRPARSGQVDVWLMTLKCAAHLENFRGRRTESTVAVLEHALVLPEILRRELAHIDPRKGRQ